MALDTTIGGASSDSYATLAEYQAYGAAMGWTLSGDDSTDEQHLRRAALYIDRNYSFPGYQQYQTQALAWPRITSLYVDGWPVDPDIIPQDIKDAQCELAYLIKGGLDPFATLEGVIKSAGAGPARVEFLGGSGRPRLVAVEGLLGPYLISGQGQTRLVRG